MSTYNCNNNDVFRNCECEVFVYRVGQKVCPYRSVGVYFFGPLGHVCKLCKHYTQSMYINHVILCSFSVRRENTPAYLSVSKQHYNGHKH